MYDKNFTGNKTSGTRNYAVRWTGHDQGNELKTFFLLDHAKNYADYTEAAQYLRTPGQNIVFATKSGDIALRTQGNWPAKWKGQGDFVMPGIDSSFLWQSMIPQDEIPFQYNPERAFVSSANQKPVPQDYPYYIGRVYPIYRGLTINRNLKAMTNITPQDMMTLQTNNEDGLASMILPKILNSLNVAALNGAQIKVLDSLSKWDFINRGNSSLPTMYDLLWRNLSEAVYADEFKDAKGKLRYPLESTLTEIMLRGDSFPFYDNIATAKIENITDVATMAFTKMCDTIASLRQNGKISWDNFNNVRVTHLARLVPFSRSGFTANGGRNSINANHGTHGPSWRMVVSLTPETEAWGIYPGGQSGNPSSKHYDDFIPDWSAEKYYKLWVMKANEVTNKRIQSVIIFSKN
jgi:penicillin amidase